MRWALIAMLLVMTLIAGLYAFNAGSNDPVVDKTEEPAPSPEPTQVSSTEVQQVTDYAHYLGFHWPSFRWGGVKYYEEHYVQVWDRTTSAIASQGLRDYINAHNQGRAASGNWLLPYLIYVDDRANGAGLCWDNAGNLPGYSLILFCSAPSGSPHLLGYSGVAHSSVVGDHQYGEASVWVRNETTTSRARELACHEIGHTMGLNHRAQTSSCMVDGVSPGSRLFDQHDWDQLNGVYNHIPD